MNQTIFITCKLQFEGWHCWLEAPERFAYLRYSHRHMFHVQAGIEVTQLNRELEFIEVKHNLEAFCYEDLATTSESPMSLSCEHIAQAITNYLIKEYGSRNIVVSVTEDDENGAEISTAI